VTQLRVDHVSKDFALRGRANVLRVLEDISLDIGEGELMVLLGPSGCGKSTLLNVIAGFLKPSTGQVLHEGIPVSKPDRRRTVVFQDYALFPWMTIQKNVEFGLKAQAVEPAERARIAREFLALVKLGGFEDRYPYEVSGGMKQRAAIARALAPNPDILLMDEPFGALDAQTRVMLQEELARIVAAARRTVVFVTHSIEEAVFLADRIVVMSSQRGPCFGSLGRWLHRRHAVGFIGGGERTDYRDWSPIGVPRRHRCIHKIGHQDAGGPEG
jgi:NitT/TauT family transport system ATP-binding protein